MVIGIGAAEFVDAHVRPLGLFTDIVQGGDRVQRQLAQFPLQVQLHAVVLDAVLGLAGVRRFIVLQRRRRAEQRGAAGACAPGASRNALALVVAGAYLQGGLQGVAQAREDLRAHRLVVDVAVGVVVHQILQLAVLALIDKGHPRCQPVLHQSAAVGALVEPRIVVAGVHLEVAIALFEGRLARNEVDRPAGGVLAPQRALRTAQNFHPFQVIERTAGGDMRADIGVIDIDAHRVDRGRRHVARAHAADVPARPLVAGKLRGDGVGHIL